MSTDSLSPDQTKIIKLLFDEHLTRAIRKHQSRPPAAKRARMSNSRAPSIPAVFHSKTKEQAAYDRCPTWLREILLDHNLNLSIVRTRALIAELYTSAPAAYTKQQRMDAACREVRRRLILLEKLDIAEYGERYTAKYRTILPHIGAHATILRWASARKRKTPR